MQSIPVYVGLDYHQDSIQVAVMDEAGQLLGNRRCANVAPEVVMFAAQFGAVQRVAVEACSGSANLAEVLRTHARWEVELAHPGFVRRMKQNPDKTDYSDARLLADLERVGYLPQVWLAPHDVRELRQVVRYRQQLVNQRRDVKLRIRALLREQRVRCGEFKAWSGPWMEWLRGTEALSEQGRWIVDRHLEELVRLGEQVTTVESRLMEMTARDVLVQYLQSFSGIGAVTAWVMRAEIGCFDRFQTGKQLSRFCGLSPRNASSGNRQADAGLIKAGNALLRATMIEAAHRLERWDPRWRAFGQRLRERGKAGSVVAAAIANRWLRWLFHQVQPARVAA
jgi:transposase